MITTLLLAFLLPGTLADADSQYARINYTDAIALYETALRQDPEDPEALWRLARVHISLADILDGEERERHIRTAERYARSCVRLDSLKSEGHTWLAAALGNLAMYEGSKTKVRLANEIRKELDIALQLNPRDDVAYSILGSFYRALGNISWLEKQLANIFLGSLPTGGYEESETALQQATALAPLVLRHQFELALLYIDWDREEDALRVLRAASHLPILVASDVPTHARVHKLIASLGG
jgi:tetratricopeptide (TPR) repeat protein